MNFKFILGIILLLCLSCLQEQNNSYNVHGNSYFLNTNDNINDIEVAYSLYKKQKQYSTTGDKVYHFFEKDKNIWLFIKLPVTLNKEAYFTIWHQYFNNAEVFRIEGDSVSSLKEINRFKNYSHKNINFRLPTWNIEKGNDITLLVKLNNSVSMFSLKFLLLSENEFLEFVQKDSYTTSLLITFLLVLFVFNLILFLSENNKSYLWYGLFVFFTIIDLIAYNDIGVKYIWYDSPFFVVYFKTFIQVLGMSCLILFQLKFYGKERISKGFSYVLKGVLYLNLFLASAFVIKYFTGWFSNIKSITWISLTAELLIMIIYHYILAFKKKIPLYLAIAFSIPLFLFQLRSLYNPDVFISIEAGLIIANAQYFGTIIELVGITYFIISEIIKQKKIASLLKEENLKLQNDFQNKTIEIQEKERNNLLNNVHDSFSGYLEALKIRLLSKSQNSPEKIQEILDAFYKEYRFLLNNLYSPKINSQNLIENLLTFCEKLNEITDDLIKPKFSLKDSNLSSEKCIHIYRIISELTTNAIKYSKASEIQVRIFNDSKDEIVIEVSDNGTGFINDKTDKNSYGLESIKNRTDKLNGLLKISSIKNKGTSITIKIPENDN